MSTTTTRAPRNLLPAEVRQALDQLSRLDKAGALPAEEAAAIRTLLAHMTEAQR